MISTGALQCLPVAIILISFVYHILPILSSEFIATLLPSRNWFLMKRNVSLPPLVRFRHKWIFHLLFFFSFRPRLFFFPLLFVDSDCIFFTIRCSFCSNHSAGKEQLIKLQTAVRFFPVMLSQKRESAYKGQNWRFSVNSLASKLSWRWILILLTL